MTNTNTTRSAGSHQDTNAPAATMNQPTIQQPPAHSSKTKELRSHPGITIKWSLDSALRRRIGLPPVAAVGAVALRMAEAGCGSC
jgi:hypothetical protein